MALYVVLYPQLLSVSYLNSYPWLAAFNRSIDYYGAFPVRGIAAVFLIVMLLPAEWIFILRSSWGYKKGLSELKMRIAPAFFALFFVYLGLTFASHLLFTAEDAFGLACTESPRPAEMRYCSPPTIAMCDGHHQPVCQNSRVNATCQEGAPVCGSGNLAICNNVPAVCPKPCIDDVVTLSIPFDTSDVCFATNIKVVRWGTYSADGDPARGPLVCAQRPDRHECAHGRSRGPEVAGHL